MNKDLLPPLDLTPKPPALPPELWALSEVETRTHRPAFHPPPQRPLRPVRRPVQVPGWLTLIVVLCALYAAVRHYGYAIDCGRVGDAVQCRVIERPAPWSSEEGSQ
jgi:hypothetical protein